MMKMKPDFISGYASAVANLGIEGDHRGANWSEAFEYLKSRLATFEPIETPPQLDRIEAALGRIEGFVRNPSA